MSDQIQQIAMRIRELREIAGISDVSLARELGITVSEYKGFEDGSTDIPVSFLYTLANKFGVELTEILTGGMPHLHTYSLVRKGEGVSVERRAAYDYESLGFNFADKKAEVFLVTVQPGPEDAPLSFNTHPGQEFEYMLDGRMEIAIDGRKMTLEEGDSIYFDSTHPHAMKALGGSPARFLAFIME